MQDSERPRTPEEIRKDYLEARLRAEIDPWSVRGRRLPVPYALLFLGIVSLLLSIAAVLYVLSRVGI